MGWWSKAKSYVKSKVSKAVKTAKVVAKVHHHVATAPYKAAYKAVKKTVTKPSVSRPAVSRPTVSRPSVSRPTVSAPSTSGRTGGGGGGRSISRRTIPGTNILLPVSPISKPGITKPKITTPAAPSAFGEEAPKSKWARAEEWVGLRTTKKLPTFQKIFGTQKEIRGGIAESSKKLPKGIRLAPWEQKLTMMEISFIKEAHTGLREEPIKTSAMFGLGFALPGVGGAVGKGLAFARVPAKAISIGGKTLGVGATALYGGSIIKRTAAGKTAEEKAGIFGRITSTEMLPLTAGAYAGLKVMPSIGGWISTRGLKSKAPKEIIAPEVLTGKKMFPETKFYSSEKHLKIFKSKKFGLPGEKKVAGWHATERAWRKKTIMLPGKRDLPGTYISGKGISIYFLRVKPSSPAVYGGDIFAGYGRPAALRITPTGIAKLPKGKGWEWMLTKAPKGKAFVPGMKREIEAVIPAGTSVIRTSMKYYTTIKGIRIPLPKFVTLPTKGIAPAIPTVKGVPVAMMSIGQLTSSYYVPSKLAMGLPYLGAYGLSKLAKPSKVSYPKPSVVPSYVLPSKPSPVVSSYVPPTPPPYIPPKPSPKRGGSGGGYTPPYVPPTPPYTPSKFKLTYPKITYKIPSVLPSFDFGIPKRKPKGLFARQPFKYRPSLGGVLFGKFSMKIPKGISMGLMPVRHMIGKPRRRKISIRPMRRMQRKMLVKLPSLKISLMRKKKKKLMAWAAWRF